LDTKYGKLEVVIPEDRKGNSDQQLIPDYTRWTDDLDTTIITLYRNGITIREITYLIKKFMVISHQKIELFCSFFMMDCTQQHTARIDTNHRP
jgi:transposase-like protein